MTLAEFLLARIVEDESKLDTATEAEAEYLRHDGMPDTTAVEVRNYWLTEVPTEWPRWLAECEAKRRIVDRYQAHHDRLSDPEESQLHANICITEYDDWILPHVALPYAYHPDYQEEWRP